MGLGRLLSHLMLALSFRSVASLQFNVTTIGASNGSSTLECWQMNRPFDISDQPGTAGSAATTLGGVSNMSYSVIPSNFDGGEHNGPYIQWVVFLAGLAHITLPDDDTTEAFISGGQFGVIFVADTADVSRKGHRTRYPGVTETIALQIPTADGTIPPHSVLHMGPCNVDEINGVRQISPGAKSSAPVSPVVEGRGFNLLPFRLR